ncbi:class A beta-lactamase [Telmatospirillum sp.]|uniref:class A beta-lactamase n=1 Tax=Telmatospirillum sp. TaxID=2079197 RepID=UPI00284FF63A|nr:class A beta-lactamase [Telmatospirillum sp.]MDR3439020.1 class A beta-lactamase [Telmatospirillum sp.]
MLTRREMLLGAVALLPACAVSRGVFALAPSLADFPDDAIATLERDHGGRLGVAAVDTASGRQLRFRADERFALCSTFKLAAAAAVLARVDRHQERLDRSIAYRQDDLLDYAPITRDHLGQGAMTLRDLCAAAIDWSDNTAANLILRTIGGPPAWTRYVRSLGDRVSRLDRVEPALNVVDPGDILDTTTPAAMLSLMRTILCGKALSERSRSQLVDWLVAAKVGRERISAGLPSSWRIGHKTGSGPRGETNDIAILWPPGRLPILVTAYYAGSSADAEARNGVLAEVGRIVSAGL